MRKEHDFLGEIEVPDEAYYGVQTMRAIENFTITGRRLDEDFIKSLAKVKKAAAQANMETGRLDRKIGNALVQAAEEIIDGEMLEHFPVDPIQGGAGTSINMNMNEVLCNRALEIIGEAKGRYDIISPNNHANMAQSTNDSLPTAIKVCLTYKSHNVTKALDYLATALEAKAEEYKDILKMGRTHLQDAVPITLGQDRMRRRFVAVSAALSGLSTALDLSTWAAPPSAPVLTLNLPTLKLLRGSCAKSPARILRRPQILSTPRITLTVSSTCPVRSKILRSCSSKWRTTSGLWRRGRAVA